MKDPNFFLDALDKAALSIVILDREQNIRWVNDVFEEWHDEKNYIGRPYEKVTPNPILAQKAINSLNSSNSKQEVFQIENKQGKTIQANISQLKNKTGGYVIVETDITNLVEAHHYQKVFRVTMGHETKGNILKSFELINKLFAAQKNDSALKEQLATLLFHIGHAFDIVKNLNDWGQPLLGNKSPVKFSHFNMTEQMNLVNSRYQPTLVYHQIQLVLKFPIDLQFRAEPEMLRAVFRNLISNGIDAIINQQKETGMEGGIIEVTGRKTENTILLKVSDNGGGIPKEDWKYLFKTVKAETFSLGTTLCKEFIVAHQGDIFIDDPKAGFDTTITITIPRKL